jgi:hypothetical protein
MDTLFPTTILTLLESFAPLFVAHHFHYFQGWVLATLLLGTTRKCVTNIARVCFWVDRHVSSWERFVSTAQWDLPAVQERMVRLLQAQLGDQLLICGAYLGWVDTTLVSKVKGTMPGVQCWHDHSGNPDRGAHLVGHHWALVGVLGVTVLAQQVTPLAWPLLAHLIPGNANPFGFVVSPEGVARAMTIWEAVCPLVAQLTLWLASHPLRVVADAYFSKAPFLNWMLALHVHVITRMRWDAVGSDDPPPETPQPPGRKRRGRPRTRPRKGKQWKLADLLIACPQESVTVLIYGHLQTLRIITRDVWIRDVAQPGRVVVIKTKGRPVILLSTDRTLAPEVIIQIYALRFALELGIREAKQACGLGEYQCTSFGAMTRFVSLSLLSGCLGRLLLLTHQQADWLQGPETTAPLSLTRLSRAVRRFILQQLFQHSASSANYQKSETAPEEIMRLVA